MNGIEGVLGQATAQGIVNAEQAAQLLRLFRDTALASPSVGPSFSMANVLHYGGGLMAIGSTSLLLHYGWKLFKGVGLLAVSGAYGALGLAATHYLVKNNEPVAAGVVGAFVVCLAPIATFGVQEMTGFLGLPSSSGSLEAPDYANLFDLRPGRHEMRFIPMEAMTVLTGCALLRYFKLPFLTFPVAVSAFYTVLDLIQARADHHPYYSYKDYGNDYATKVQRRNRLFQRTLCLLGSSTIVLARVLEKLIIPYYTGHSLASGRNGDYSFWFYLLGVISVVCASEEMDFLREQSTKKWFRSLVLSGVLVSLGEIWDRDTFTRFGMGMLLYSLARPVVEKSLAQASLSTFVSSVLLVLGPLVNKKYLTVISGLQVWGYLARLSHDYFRDSVAFPLVLTGLGFGLIGAGLKMQRYEDMLTSPATVSFFAGIKQWLLRFI